MISRVLISAVLFVSSSAIAQTEVPNVFQPGEPARAADVNANFDLLESSMDEIGSETASNAADIANNAANITATQGDVATNSADIRANMNAIGTLQSGSGVFAYSGDSVLGRVLTLASNTALWLVSSEGFVFLTEVENRANYLGPEKTVFFDSTGCTGRSFIDVSPTWDIVVGTVFRPDGPAPAPAYYTRRGEFQRIQNTVTASVAENKLCTDRIETRSLMEVFPNDEGVTGVSNDAPTSFLTIGVP